MEPLNLKLERPDRDEELAQAYERAEEYLRAFGIENKRVLIEILHVVISRVSESMDKGDARHPVEIAIDALETHIAHWYAQALRRDEAVSRLDTLTRVSLFRAHRSTRWKSHFMRMNDFPDLLSEELKRTDLKSQPEKADAGDVSPQSLDLGAVGKLAEDTWTLFGRNPVLSIISMGIAYLLVITFILYFIS